MFGLSVSETVRGKTWLRAWGARFSSYGKTWLNSPSWLTWTRPYDTTNSLCVKMLYPSFSCVQTYQDLYGDEETPTLHLKQGIDLRDLSGPQGRGSEFEVDFEQQFGM